MCASRSGNANGIVYHCPYSLKWFLGQIVTFVAYTPHEVEKTLVEWHHAGELGFATFEM